uniref:Uncharacterized protein n=1 Tax=Quercus lobata TaxID=97700 RepID=A0A7N2L283_QUELO
MEDHKDIIDVLTAVHLLNRVQPPIPEAPNEEAATPAGQSSTEGPSTSTAPTRCPSHPPVATPRQEPPSHSTSIGPSSAIDPPHVQVEQAVGLPAVAKGLPKRISKAPPYGTGGHKHGHNARPKASDKGHARPSPHYTRRHKVQKSYGIYKTDFPTSGPNCVLFIDIVHCDTQVSIASFEAGDMRI